MFYAYARQDNVDVRVARIFNTYGPRMHMNDGRVVSNFIIQALEGTPLTVSWCRAEVLVGESRRGLCRRWDREGTYVVVGMG